MPISFSPADLGPQVASLHVSLRAEDELAGVDRIAAALYDPGTDVLKTFVHSTLGECPLVRYDARLADVPSLAVLARERRDRTIDDLSIFEGSASEHSRRVLELGYRSSYTVPFYDRGALGGFLFFDSRLPAAFTSRVVGKLKVYGQLLALLVLHSFGAVRTLRSAVQVASRLAHERDPETGAHLERMARYSRLVARGLAGSEGLSDEFVEYLYLFAPMHDVGKVAIPDRILLKDARLEKAELEVMREHVTRGASIVDGILSELGVQGLPHTDLLRNVVLRHHEAFDGSGYPDGLAGDEIPIEGRIVAVADVFDALTSARPYKEAWSREEALAYLCERAGRQFDRRCVEALVAQRDPAEAIRLRFPDEDRSGRPSGEGNPRDPVRVP